jgi:hypothetical protein
MKLLRVISLETLTFLATAVRCSKLVILSEETSPHSSALKTEKAGAFKLLVS